MHNWHRIFAYVTGAIVFGLLLILISHNFIQYVAREGATGYLFLLGFGLIFLNLNFGISRRFVIKTAKGNWVCYLMAFLTFLPSVFWVYTKDMGLGDTESVFIMTVVFAAFLGSYFGIRRGSVKREQYIRQITEEEKRDLPDELKRPHDDLNKN